VVRSGHFPDRIARRVYKLGDLVITKESDQRGLVIKSRCAVVQNRVGVVSASSANRLQRVRVEQGQFSEGPKAVHPDFVQSIPTPLASSCPHSEDVRDPRRDGRNGQAHEKGGDDVQAPFRRWTELNPSYRPDAYAPS
jgi:hypothetical protein